MTDKPFLLDAFLPYRLSVLSNRLSAAIAESYSRRYGLSIPEWRVIAVLAHAPGASAAEVAERTAMDKVAVSRAVRRLQQTGRVSRRMAAGDRRRSMLDLTAEGRRIYDRITPALRRYEEQLLAVLDVAERRTMDTLLSRLERRARELAPPVID
ncbi:MarR family winged helix-turn-helix transcriptional regulator [Thioalkalivibrio sp. XN279]|uniref:MarR family winged helix-turn-helix transcriptional regulator n=1 Tax=Thioalkalivibrio sp. XN279 TaxID=2714953 RepID=UPI001409D10D|nr:MarR family winged helix-turn-helix transcriptional regulator [Thioalkalivibrio sp. XN279]NHA15900.1 winged helix-turn-helix transcriptional regulator [Thioalkalivibrio sp. XN279]